MKKVLIWGRGITGQSAYRYFTKLGHQVKFLDEKNSLLSDTYDFVLVSPGVSCWHPLYQSMQRQGIPIVTDIDIFLANYNGKVIAVTGTNGKSTLVAKLTFIAQRLAIDAYAAGNIGYPCLDVPVTAELTVLELSSFHLAHGVNRRLDLAILLNIAPDHQQWHKSFKHYKFSKKLIHNVADKSIEVSDAGLIDANGVVFPNNDLLSIIADTMNWPIAKVNLADFQKLPHRQQIFYLKQRKWVNDSKATNAHATLYACNKFKADSVILILAGISKGWHNELIPSNVRLVIVVGKLANWSMMAADAVTVANLSAAVSFAYANSKAYETILFAPGGASFDKFENFAQRGDKFMELVKCLD